MNTSTPSTLMLDGRSFGEFPSRTHESWRYSSFQKLRQHTFELTKPSPTIPSHFDLQNYSEFNTLLIHNSGAIALSPDIQEVYLRQKELPQTEVQNVFLDQVDHHLLSHIQSFRYASSKPLLIYYLNPQLSNQGILNHIHIEVTKSCEIVEYCPPDTSIFFHRFNMDVHIHQAVLFRSIHFQAESGFRFFRYHFTLHDHAELSFESYDEASALSRNEIIVQYTGEQQKSRLTSLGHLKGHCHLNQETTIQHDHPNCETIQEYRHIVEDDAVAVFAGQLHVQTPGSIARQLNRNLILSPKARAYSRPMLRIDCSDVTCSHGASVSRPSDEELFYLRARGIDESYAKQLLASAFAQVSQGLSQRIQQFRGVSNGTP